MAQQIVNIGTSVNKGDGDPLRTAFDKINDNFTELYAQDPSTDSQTLTLVGNTLSISGGNSVSLNISPTGDLKGSVYADDSTLLVDGVNGTIPAANLSGTLPALDGSALTNITLTTADITDYGVFTGTEEAFATLTGATGTVAHDCDNGHIFYHTTPAADWTANFTNLGLTAEHATTLSIVIAQGATAYIPSAVEIGGVAQTLLWQGGSAPSGTANGTDVVAFSILNDGGTYVVMGQLVGFS